MKKYLLAILLLFIVLVVVGSVTFFFGPKDEEKFEHWNVYRNDTHGYEIEYPEDYRIGLFLMEERLANEQGFSLDDWVVITDMTIEQEQEYLESDCGYGGCFAPHNFPVGTVLVSTSPSLSFTLEIEESIKEGDGVWEDAGFKYTDFYSEQTDCGLEIRKWKFYGRGSLQNASIALPEESLEGFDEIKFSTPMGEGYDEELFNKIVSTFKIVVEQ